MSEEMEAMEKLDIIDLMYRFLKVLRRFWILVLALVVGCSGLFYLRAKKSFVPMYEAKANFSVRSSYSTDDIFSTSYYDNTAAQQLASAFPYMLNTEIMRDAMKEQIGKSYINGSITASSVANTNLFVLKVRSSNPQDAYDILCAAIECYPQVAVYMVDNPQVTVRDEPKVPSEPYNSFSWKGPVFKGALVGGLLAAGILAVITLCTRTVSTVEQLKAVGNRPVMAVLPKVAQKKRRSGKPSAILPGSDPGMAESLQSLALKLRKAMEQENQKIIAITSTVSGEGKTTISANLARVLASDGSRVAVVDADLRKQSVASQFRVGACNVNFLGCVQNEKIPVKDYLQQVPNTSLAFLSGNSVQAKHYSIDSKGVRRVLETLAEEYDYVVVDTPPCGLVADTALLCHFAKCVLYVVKPDTVGEGQIQDNLNNLFERGVPIEGFVFNGLARTSRGYGYRYGYGYGGKYGYSYGKKK